jgi:Tle cognate immunity protein 4 C-terminal domain
MMPPHPPSREPRPQRRHLARLGLAWLAGAALATGAALAASPSNPTERPSRSERMTPPAPTASAICLGRFGFTLPDGWTVAGREQKIYRSRVSDDLRAGAATLPGLSATMRVLRSDLPAGDPLLREFSIDGVGPGAWFGLGDPNSPSRRVVLLAGSAEAGVRMEALATQGKEAQAQEGLRQLAAGYRPGARTGFCLPQGAFQVDPGRNETTRLAAEHPRLPGAELRFSTEAVTTPRTDGPLVDPAADAQAMAGSGTTLKPLGQADRQVAGFTGRDSRAELQEPRKPPTLVYRWFHPGQPASATAPELIIALDGPASAKAALDAAWNQLLDSVRPVPVR